MKRPVMWGLGGLLLGSVGCKDLTGSQALPAGTPDPSTFNTPAGALGMRNAALATFAGALAAYVVDAGLLTDELEYNYTGSSPVNLAAGEVRRPLDERILPEQEVDGSRAGSNSYAALQRARGMANQAIGTLKTYAPAAPTALRGELYAMQGATEILLADLFCSGVPLSTLDFQGDFTVHGSSTRAQVDSAALATLDTALSLSADSARVLNLARVLKGRAWVDLGQYDSAAAAVAAVPNGFQDTLAVAWAVDNGFTEMSCHPINCINADAAVSSNEGGNGLPYADDPRSAVVVVGTSAVGLPLTFPAKYGAALNGSGYAQFPVADWIEARLIQAEAALHNPARWGDWLALLNALRQTATVPGQTAPLVPLTDPGLGLSAADADTARVSLLFQERAYWLFATGHRQGDLRRLIRQYGRRQDQVYPTGAYLAPGTGVYGSDVTAPIPAAEASNHLFHGCLDRGA